MNTNTAEMMSTQGGFTLLEAVAALAIIGFVAAGFTMLIYHGTEGYITMRTNTSTSAKVQIAMDRIRMELVYMQAITSIDKTVGNSNIVFTNDNGILTTLAMNQGASTVTLGGNTLLDNVSAFTLATACTNMAGGSGVSPDLGSVTVTMTQNNIPNAFSVVITPRTRISCF